MEREKNPASQVEQPRERKPYQPPTIVEEAVFEGLALKCGAVGIECGGGASGAS